MKNYGQLTKELFDEFDCNFYIILWLQFIYDVCT